MYFIIKPLSAISTCQISLYEPTCRPGDNMYPRIRDLRIEANLTQVQVANLLHCTQQAYSKYETGFLEIPIDVLLFLAEHYNTTTDYILGRRKNREVPQDG